MPLAQRVGITPVRNTVAVVVAVAFQGVGQLVIVAVEVQIVGKPVAVGVRAGFALDNVGPSVTVAVQGFPGLAVQVVVDRVAPLAVGREAQRVRRGGEGVGDRAGEMVRGLDGVMVVPFAPVSASTTSLMMSDALVSSLLLGSRPAAVQVWTIVVFPSVMLQ
jgi:hypothetical protein